MTSQLLDDQPTELIQREIKLVEDNTRKSIPGDAAENIISLNILLADDNIVDQKIVIRVLKRMGHIVTPVMNGKEAVDAIENQTFDIVFMDILLPELDGLKATQLIRKRERALEAVKPVPIIALTGHNVDKIKDACLGAGMDDCMSKPVNVPIFKKILINVMDKTVSSILDLTDLMENVEYDIECVQDIISSFRIQALSDFEKLKESLMDSDMDDIKSFAHRIKGMARNIGAERLGGILATLEKDAMEGNQIKAESWIKRLDSELETTFKEIAQVNWKKFEQGALLMNQ